MKEVLSPDLVAATFFLNMLDAGGTFTFQTFDDKKKTRIPPRKSDPLARVFHGTLAQHTEALTSLQQQGAGVYVMVNRGDGVVHDGQKTCRCAASVVAIRALFIDLDGSPLDPVLQMLMPHIAIESSPNRWHGYWFVSGCPLDEFSRRQKQIAQRFSGDLAVHDLPRVMRVPGFWHQKGTPYMTKIIYPK